MSLAQDMASGRSRIHLKMFEMGHQDCYQQADPYVSGILLPDWLMVLVSTVYVYGSQIHEVPTWVLHNSTISSRRMQPSGEWRDVYHVLCPIEHQSSPHVLSWWEVLPAAAVQQLQCKDRDMPNNFLG